MKVHKTSAIVLLLVICITAIALGYAGSKSIPEENTAFVTVDANSAGIIIPQYLITSEVRDLLSEMSNEYPDSILFGEEEVTLIGSKTVDNFKKSISENNIDFNWAAVYSFYELETSVVATGPYILYSTSDNSVNPITISYNEVDPTSYNSMNSITISYDELEKILDGNNETVSYYRELLNNSKDENNTKYGFYAKGNVGCFHHSDGESSVASVVVINKEALKNSSLQHRSVVKAISSSGNNSE